MVYLPLVLFLCFYVRADVLMNKSEFLFMEITQRLYSFPFDDLWEETSLDPQTSDKTRNDTKIIATPRWLTRRISDGHYRAEN